MLFPRLFGDGAARADLRRGLVRVARRANATTLFAADGGTIDERGKIARGAISQAKGGVARSMTTIP